MHSSETLAFNNRFFSIWHIDPCTDGSDDSCGWSTAKLTADEKNKINVFVDNEFSCINDIYKRFDDNHRIEVLYTLYGGLKWHLYRERLTVKDHMNIMSFAWNIFDDIRIYNDNPKEDFIRLCFCLSRHLKTFKRKWYQHPKYHIHHWRIHWHRPITNKPKSPSVSR